MAKRAQVVDHLRDVALFSGCSNKELQEIAKVSEQIDVPAGHTIVSQGDVGQEAYVVLSGEAVVRRGTRRLANLGPGDPIGEMALLDRGPRTAYVVATTDMELLRLTSRDFGTALEASPALARKLLATLATRVRDLDRAVFG